MSGLAVRHLVSNKYLRFSSDQLSFLPTATKDKKEYLDIVVAWALGEIDGYEYFELSGERHTLERFKHHLGIVVRTGTLTQTAIAELYGRYSEVTAATQGKGVANSLVTVRLDAADPQFQSEPQVFAVLRGFKLTDPRDSSVAWSSNPALQLLHYLMSDFGFGLGAGNIDLDSFKAVADICDELVAIPARDRFLAAGDTYYNEETGEEVTVSSRMLDPTFRPWQGAATMQKRSECDLVVSSATERLAVVEQMLATMRAWLYWSDGKFKVRALAPEKVVMSFNKDNIGDKVGIGIPRRQNRLNAAVMRFPNRNKGYDYDSVRWPAIGSAQALEWVAADGGERYKSFTIEGCVDRYRAEDLAEALVRDSRQALRVSFNPLSAAAILLEPCDLISLTYEPQNWVNKFFVIQEVNIDLMLNVQVTAKEYDPQGYAWSGKFIEPPVQKPLPFSFNYEPVKNLFAQVVQEDRVTGGTTSEIIVTWDEVPNYHQAYVCEMRRDGQADWSGVEAGFLPQTLLTGLKDGTTYYIRVSYLTRLGGRAAYATTSVATPGAMMDTDPVVWQGAVPYRINGDITVIPVALSPPASGSQILKMTAYVDTNYDHDIVGVSVLFDIFTDEARTKKVAAFELDVDEAVSGTRSIVLPSGTDIMYVAAHIDVVTTNEESEENSLGFGSITVFTFTITPTA